MAQEVSSSKWKKKAKHLVDINNVRVQSYYQQNESLLFTESHISLLQVLIFTHLSPYRNHKLLASANVHAQVLGEKKSKD